MTIFILVIYYSFFLAHFSTVFFLCLETDPLFLLLITKVHYLNVEKTIKSIYNYLAHEDLAHNFYILQFPNYLGTQSISPRIEEWT